MFNSIIKKINALYPNQSPVSLHSPVFNGNEKKYLNECIDSTYVSYVGKYVSDFEKIVSNYVQSKHSVAVVNGTSALQIALKVSGVMPGDEVITQSLTFVATANAISHCGAIPILMDVDLDTLGMSVEKTQKWLSRNTLYDKNLKSTINRKTGRRISAIVPMHTFGIPCKIDEIVDLANSYEINVIEDSAESLGSFYKNKHTGTYGLAGILSFNGNKTITCGGGGMIITDDKSFADRAKHLTTTAKVDHNWEFIHDEIGYNYRLSNVNAAIGLAQMEKIDSIIENKKKTKNIYSDFFNDQNVNFVEKDNDQNINYWLNSILFDSFQEKEDFLDFSNKNKVLCRPIWRQMKKLDMYKKCQSSNLDNSDFIESRLVNIPSGIR